MRIIRFIDGRDRTQYGLRHDDEATTTRLDGDPFGECHDTGDPADVVKLLSPLEPAAILCIGLNYRRHAEETGATIPKFPVLFMKNPSALNHPGDPIKLPPSCLDPPQVDYEVELAVVMGRDAKDVREADALDYVLGYTIGNDVSARWWQKHGCGGQWTRGKSFDSFCPLGPELVTTDEIADPQDLELRCVLNGDVMQEGNTSDMLFPVATLIACLSDGMTLRQGTVILTGTPPGVGVARTPPVFLKPGDQLELTIERIGTLANPVA